MRNPWQHGISPEAVRDGRSGCRCRAAESPAGGVMGRDSLNSWLSLQALLIRAPCPEAAPCGSEHVENQRVGNKEQSALGAHLEEAVIVPTD